MDHLNSLSGESYIDQGSLTVAKLDALNVSLAPVFTQQDILMGHMQRQYLVGQSAVARYMYQTLEYGSYVAFGLELGAGAAGKWAFMSASERIAHFGLFGETVGLATGVDGSAAYILQQSKVMIPHMRVYPAGKPLLRVDSNGKYLVD